MYELSYADNYIAHTLYVKKLRSTFVRHRNILSYRCDMYIVCPHRKVVSIAEMTSVYYIGLYIEGRKSISSIVQVRKTILYTLHICSVYCNKCCTHICAHPCHITLQTIYIEQLTLDIFCCIFYMARS